MNRAQRRQIDKSVHMKGAGDWLARIDQPPQLEEGTRVRIRCEQIMQRKDYSSKSDTYRAFVEQCKINNPVFTVHRPEQHAHRSLVELNEDTTNPKWLWWDGDLKVVKEDA